MITFFAFIIVFGILVFVHELGHFLMARRLGVRVEEFGFGFPPRLWSRKKGDTLYSFNLIPLGGFVRFFGEHGEGEEDPRSFAAKTKFEKSLILVSGVIMNFVLAFLVLTFLYSFGFKTLIPGMEKHKWVKNGQQIEIIKIEEKTPAAEVLKEGDIIKKIEGEEVHQDMDLFVKLNAITKDNPEKEVSLTVIRDGKEETKTLKTYESEVEARNGKVKVRRIGVVLETKGEVSAPVYLAPVVASSETFRLSNGTLAGILGFFGKIITNFTISENVVGPVAIVSMAGSIAKAGIQPLLQFVAILSVSLAVINIMPIPALDGGHLLILLVEKVKGRDLSHEAKNMVQFLGFAFLVVLMILITIRDLTGISALEYIKKIF